VVIRAARASRPVVGSDGLHHSLELVVHHDPDPLGRRVVRGCVGQQGRSRSRSVATDHARRAPPKVPRLGSGCEQGLDRRVPAAEHLDLAGVSAGVLTRFLGRAGDADRV